LPFFFLSFFFLPTADHPPSWPTTSVKVTLTTPSVKESLTSVFPKKASAQLKKALDALDSAEGPRERLSAARRMRQVAEELESELVEEARSAGLRWADIGQLYGTSKQGVQQRFRRRIPKDAE
jgi:hypothetical protein